MIFASESTKGASLSLHRICSKAWGVQVLIRMSLHARQCLLNSSHRHQLYLSRHQLRLSHHPGKETIRSLANMKLQVLALLALANVLQITASPVAEPVAAPAPVAPTTDSICIGTVFFCGRNTIKKRLAEVKRELGISEIQVRE